MPLPSEFAPPKPHTPKIGSASEQLLSPGLKMIKELIIDGIYEGSNSTAGTVAFTVNLAGNYTGPPLAGVLVPTAGAAASFECADVSLEQSGQDWTLVCHPDWTGGFGIDYSFRFDNQYDGVKKTYKRILTLARPLVVTAYIDSGDVWDVGGVSRMELKVVEKVSFVINKTKI